MPLPTAAELTDPNATNTQMKERLGRLAENAQNRLDAQNALMQNGNEIFEVSVSNIGSFQTSCFNLTTNQFQTFDKWVSFKFALTGKEKSIKGNFASHFNGINGSANNIKIPALAFFDRDNNLLSYNLPEDAVNGKKYEIFEIIPKSASYVILAFTTAGTNNTPTSLAGYGSFKIAMDAEHENSAAMRALTIVEQQGLFESNEATIYLKHVAKNPTVLAGRTGSYAFNKVYQNWFSHKIDLANVSKISGSVSAFYNPDGRYVPALVIYNSANAVIQSVERTSGGGGLLDFDIDITSEMSYVVFNTDITKNSVVKIKRSTGSDSITKRVNGITNLLSANGIIDLNKETVHLTGNVDDPIVLTGSGGNYVKSNTYAAWYCKTIDLSNCSNIKGIASSYYHDTIRIPAIVIYNTANEVINYYELSSPMPDRAIDQYPFDIVVTSEMSYMVLQYQNLRTYPYYEIQYSEDIFSGIGERVEKLENQTGGAKPNFNLLIPKQVYNVANDIDYKVASQTYTGARSELKRNFSAVLHLDNYIPFVDHEPQIAFEDGGIKKVIPAYSPVITAGAIENPNLNNGSNIYTETVTYKVKGNRSEDQTFTLENRSVLNSASKDKVPTILIIGDSVSFGQDAYFPGSKDKWNYTMILNKMFMNDRQQNGGVGYGFRTVGTVVHTDKDGVKSFNEAYSGTTLQGSGLFTNSKFLDGSNNFSFQNWLDKYRTCDDSGNRLFFNASGATTGTAGTNNIGYLADGSVTSLKIGSLVSNTLSHVVYMPTHVFCFHGSNAPVGVSDYNLFISRVRNTFPNAVIGLGVPHVAGTYFPSKYPNVYRPAIWQYSQTYNGRHVTTVQTLISSFWNSTQEANKVFVLPTFWVNPSAEAFSSIYVSEPHNEITGEGLIEMPVGQRVDVHVGSRAQAAYAYQLYAWLKWTSANNLF